MKTFALCAASAVMIASWHGAAAFTPVGCGFGGGGPDAANMQPAAASPALGSPDRASISGKVGELERAAESGDGRSTYFLAESYALGLGVEQDLEKSRALYGLAAERSEGAMAKSAACRAAAIGELIAARRQQARQLP